MWPGTRSLSETIMLLGMKVVDYDGLLEGGQQQSEGITKKKTLFVLDALASIKP